MIIARRLPLKQSPVMGTCIAWKGSDLVIGGYYLAQWAFRSEGIPILLTGTKSSPVQKIHWQDPHLWYLRRGGELYRNGERICAGVCDMDVWGGQALVSINGPERAEIPGLIFTTPAEQIFYRGEERFALIGSVLMKWRNSDWIPMMPIGPIRLVAVDQVGYWKALVSPTTISIFDQKDALLSGCLHAEDVVTLCFDGANGVYWAEKNQIRKLDFVSGRIREIYQTKDEIYDIAINRRIQMLALTGPGGTEVIEIEA